MTDPAPRLVLLSPPVEDATAFAASLTAALAAGEVASVLLRLAEADERTLVNRVKTVAAVTAQRDCALVVVADDLTGDVGAIVTRGNADGAQVSRPGDVRAFRDRLGADRIVGAGGIGSRHDAMFAGEGSADYVLFGGQGKDGEQVSADDTLHLAEWWAAIFETPCIVVAPTMDAIPSLVATRAEFIALRPDIWIEHPAKSVAQASTLLTPAGESAT